MLQNLTGWHALIVLAVVLLIFGAAKLPALARGVGQSMRILKEESRVSDDPNAATGATGDHRGESPVAVTATVPGSATAHDTRP